MDSGERPEVDDVFLQPGDAIELRGKVWVVQSRTAKHAGYIFSDPDSPGVDHPMSRADIKAWYDAEELTFVARSEFGLPIGVRKSLRRTMRAFAASEREEIFRRLRYVQAFQALGADFSRSEVTLQPVCDAVAAKRNDMKSHDWTTVYEWWKRWTRAGKDPRALAPSTSSRGNRKRKVEDYKAEAMDVGLDEWLVRHAPSMATAYKAVINHCNMVLGGEKVALAMESPYPSDRAFRALCSKHNRAEMLNARSGPETARYEMYPVGTGPDVRLPFERVEADFKYLRLIVVDDTTGLPLGTPYLMAAIDCYSGCIGGFDIGFDPPSYVSAARCLKHLIDFKDLSRFPRDEDGDPVIRRSYPINGVPHQFFLDNDQAFHAESFVRSALALGCNIDYIPRGEPWKKGRIERFWLTVQMCFLDMFPGKVLRFGKADKDYDPSEDAVITLGQLRLIITKAIVDIYHEEPEPQSGVPRIDRWLKAVQINPPRRVRDHESMIELVGAYENRVAERRGIALFGLRYNSPQLAKYRSGFLKDPRVDIRYDPQDISRVWIVDAKKGISFPVPCTRPDYVDGLSLHQHRVIRHSVAMRTPAGRIRMRELLIAKANLYKLGKEMLGKKSSRRGRMRIAQFLGVGRELLDEMAKRVHDPAKSAQHIGLDDQIDDPDDEASAKRDEAMVNDLINRKPKTDAKSEASSVASDTPAAPPSLPDPAPVSPPARPKKTPLEIEFDD